MSKPHRIAAGGITFHEDSVLLVRYPGGSGGTYLAAPGGALEDDENVLQAILRETREETGVLMRPIRVVLIEDLVFPEYKMSKVWMICDFIEGKIRRTIEAEREGILEADWFTAAELRGETVYPPVLIQRDWAQLQSADCRVEIPPSRTADSA